ncbi:MAG TPA: hypothetical protein P5227_11705 [Emcibacteraceae bacterium]|nr:hypothetical protein [Emcibacteraceae bacterium]HRW30656.1 hypothetical protein [Emcibacteraceae bacterium]
MSKIKNHPVIWTGPDNAEKLLILAHGAGAPMDTEFMNFFAETLARKNIKILRFEFPYMAIRRDGGGKRPPNPLKTLLTSWRQIIDESRKKHKGPIFIGGKSMGGRIASMVADDCDVNGLILLGYPFYAPGKLDKPRIDHLINLKTPALILQGERDPMGSEDIVSRYILSNKIKVVWLKDGNHDLKPRIKSGRSHHDNLVQSAIEISDFIEALK